MSHENCFAIGVVALAAIATASAPSDAATIAFQGFEPIDTYAFTVSGTGGSVSSVANGTVNERPQNTRINNGNNSFQVAGGTATLDFDVPVSVADFDDVTIEIRLAGIGTTAGNGPDTGDNVQVFVSVNGAPFPLTPDLFVHSDRNSQFGYLSTNVISTVAGTPATAQNSSRLDPPEAFEGYSTLRVTLPDTATTFDLRIQAFTDTTGEIYAIDDISVTGTPVPEPTMLGLAAVGGAALLRRRSRRFQV